MCNKSDYSRAAGAGAGTLQFRFLHLFAGVILLGNIVHGQALDEHANFGTFPLAMLTLFRVAVGDDWTSLMQASGDNNGTCPQFTPCLQTQHRSNGPFLNNAPAHLPVQDCMVQPPDCDPDAGNCGSQAVWL